jgi:hypothetical protein
MQDAPSRNFIYSVELKVSGAFLMSEQYSRKRSVFNYDHLLKEAA